MLKRILGLLGWLGVALVFAAVAARYLPFPKLEPYANKLAIAGLVCTLLYIFSQWREVGQAFAGRQARFGTLAVASVLVVLGILAAINYLSTQPQRRWDLTAAHQFSLRTQTKKVLQDLKEPVTVRVFAKSDDFQRFRIRLDEHTQSKQVSTEYIDPEKAGVAQQLGVTALITVVFEHKGRNEKVMSDGEQELTNALIKVIQGRQPKVISRRGTARRTRPAPNARLQTRSCAALTSGNFILESWCWGSSRRSPQTPTSSSLRGRRPISSRPRSTC
jgi:ABC-type uncharacterized transport system involved in gliding motility auxiliary subunit